MPEIQGLIIVNTGAGKGKTTAALGMGLRAWGHGFNILIVQFIKNSSSYGELLAAQQLGSKFVIHTFRDGIVGNRIDEGKSEQEVAQEALQFSEKEILSGQWDMIILDEINPAIHLGYIQLAAVFRLFDIKPGNLHLVLTGCDAAPEIIERADLVTEMMEVKHHSQNKLQEQAGIDF